MSLVEFLLWIVSGGGSVLASSWLLERMTWFQNMNSQAKEYAWFATSAVLGTGAWYLLEFNLEVLIQYNNLFVILAGIFGSVFLGKIFHKADKEKK